MKDIPPNMMSLILHGIIGLGAGLIAVHCRDWKVGLGIYFIAWAALMVIVKNS